MCLRYSNFGYNVLQLKTDDRLCASKYRWCKKKISKRKKKINKIKV